MNNIDLNTVIEISYHSVNGGTILNYLLSPMTPEAITAPVLPFFKDYGLFARPRSSSFALMTTERPKIEESP
jgi:hypothetical protein